MMVAKLLGLALLCLSASASTIKGKFHLIIDPALNVNNNKLTADFKEALSKCFSVSGACADACANDDGACVDKCAGDCANKVKSGVTIDSMATVTAQPGDYEAYYDCESGPYPGHSTPECTTVKSKNLEDKDQSPTGLTVDESADPPILQCGCGIRAALNVREVTFTINSPFADGARAKSVGQNSDMMTSGLLNLLPRSLGLIYSYEITSITASTGNDGCTVPLAISTDAAQDNSALPATNDPFANYDESSLSTGEIFGIVVGALALVGAIAAAVVLVKRKGSGGGMRGAEMPAVPSAADGV